MNTESIPNIIDAIVIKTKRGAIKATVSTSEPVVDASGDFAIFVIIENPYDVPITLYSVETHIPVQLVDAFWYQNYAIGQMNLWDSEANQQEGWQKIFYWFRNILRKLDLKIRKPTSPRIAEAVGTENKEILEYIRAGSPRITIEGDAKNSEIIAGSFNEIWNLTFRGNLTNNDLDRIFMKTDDFKGGKRPVFLQPGNAVVKQFILRAKENLFFRPISYKFQIQIKYGVDNLENLDTVPFNLQIRATINSIMSGSVFGSILGTVARSIGQSGTNLSVGVLVLSAIFGAIAVVAFARKESAQTIISIEDFWGGMLIGFLVGYLGEQYFRSIIGV